MIEIFPNLFIGTEQDYEFNVKGKPDWVVVHACKEPYHRRELRYTTLGAPKGHPEYLIARRERRLILNLVDATNPWESAKHVYRSLLELFTEKIKLNDLGVDPRPKV